MNIIFLDFDGVINIPWWYKDKQGNWKERYNFPHDGVVNNTQAVQWVSEFCERYNYDIVVTSTWRMGDFDYVKCLYDSGLRENIKVIGKTPVKNDAKRGDEITEYLSLHPEIKNYLIFDDDEDMTVHIDRLVKCDTVTGFTLNQFNHAISLHKAFNNK